MAEVHFNPLAVRQAASTNATRQLTFAEGLPGVVENLADVAAILHQAGDADKVNELRQAVKQLLAISKEATLHAAALREMQNSYEMTAEATDFEGQLSARVQQLAAEQRYDPAHDDVYHSFEQTATGGEGLEEQIDDDIAIEGGANQLAPNERCPISGKLLLEMTEPVADSKGFVYDKAAILGWLRQQHESPAKCPVADLKPAKKVVKAQQRTKRGGATQQQAQQDFLDVE